MLTGPDSATARKAATSTQPIGLRSRKTRDRAIANATTMNSVRTMIRAENAGTTCTVGGSARGLEGGSSGTPTGRELQVTSLESFSHRAQELRAQAGDAEHAGADVGADDRPDLREQLRVAPVDVAAALGQALGLVGRLDVLDREPVAAVLAPPLEVGDQALERAAGGAHALDGLHLALDRENRLDLQRRADPPADG